MADSVQRIAIVGGGLVGLVAALALADSLPSNGEVVLVAPASQVPDQRTTAMLMPTVDMLRRLGAWGELEHASAALRTMRIIDAGKRLVTAPLVEFRSSEIEAEAFGYNVPNDQAAELLGQAINRLNNVTIIDAYAKALDTEQKLLFLDNGQQITADIFVAADGRLSLLRQEAGIGTKQWSYPQTAVVATFAHSLPHGDVSTELHTRTGPFTQVPLPATAANKHRSSLVWVVASVEADRLLEADIGWIGDEIERKLQSSLGKVTVEGDLQKFPLSGMTTRNFGKNHVVLIGEAAHVMPPIGAQGFNLGVSDINALAQLITANIPVDQICSRYDRKRRAEVLTKIGGIDILNRSLLSAFLPVHLGRSMVLGAFSGNTSLRKLLMNGMMYGPSTLLNLGRDRPAASRS